MAEARTLFPGGVNSPVRAFRSVGGNPIVFDRVKGPYCWDVDGNKYVDYIGSWGPAIVGAANDEVNEVLKKQLEKGTSFGAPGALEVRGRLHTSARMGVVFAAQHAAGCCMGWLRSACMHAVQSMRRRPLKPPPLPPPNINHQTPTTKHQPPKNVLAKMVIERVPSVEMVRFVSSGTEACLSVLRLMRAYTKREKVIKFVGCYHGHADSFLVKAGSGVATLGLPDSPGVPASTAAATLNATYNDLDSVRALFAANKGQVRWLGARPDCCSRGFGWLLPRQRRRRRRRLRSRSRFLPPFAILIIALVPQHHPPPPTRSPA
jgi:hypothetical protein